MKKDKDKKLTYFLRAAMMVLTTILIVLFLVIMSMVGQQAKTRTCVMAWKALMEQAQADLPYKAFPTSAGVVERRYCTQSGLLAGAGCPSTAVGYYRADDLPDTCTYSHAAPQAAAPAENTDDAVPTQPVIPTDTSALDTE